MCVYSACDHVTDQQENSHPSMPRPTSHRDQIGSPQPTQPRGLNVLHGVAYRLGLLLVLFAVPTPQTVAADDAKVLAYGKHLSAECSGCHRVDGIDNGIPSITGWAPIDFIATVGFFKDGSRPNPAMISVARSLDDEQVEALATYYGSLPMGHRRAAPPAAKKK